MENLEKSYCGLLRYPENSYVNKTMVYFHGRFKGDYFKAKKYALKAAELNEEDQWIYGKTK